MTLNELKGEYSRLSQEIESLAASGERNQARLMRLIDELDRVHALLADLRRRTLAAPTLRDAVAWSEPAVAQAA
jgi:hypothetical protein